jgi:hypothetical protein
MPTFPPHLARRSSAAGLGRNQTGGGGSDGKEKQADRKQGETAPRPNRLRIVAHITRVEQRDSQGQGTTGHPEIDERLRTHASRHPVDRPRQRPAEQPEWYRALSRIRPSLH